MMLASYFIPAPLMRTRNKRLGIMEDQPKFANINQRLHPMAERKLTTAWRNAGADHARLAGVPIEVDQPVFIEAWIHLRRNVKYDAQNLYPSAKAAVDGLIGDHKFLPGDDNKWVVGPLCLPGRKQPDDCGIHLRVFPRLPGTLYPLESRYSPYPYKQH